MGNSKVATKRRSVNLVKEVDKKQKLEGAKSETEVDEKQKVESTEAEKQVHEKRKVESTKAKKTVAKKKKVESIDEESDSDVTIYPMDDLGDDYDDDTSSEEELTTTGARFVSIVRKG